MLAPAEKIRNDGSFPVLDTQCLVAISMILNPLTIQIFNVFNLVHRCSRLDILLGRGVDVLAISAFAKHDSLHHDQLTIYSKISNFSQQKSPVSLM